MIEIIISSIILSVIHASIPNHWIPIIAIGKAEKWTQKQTLFATLFSGFAHTLSTVLIGVMVGFAGYKLSEKYSFISHQLAPLILIVLGIVYILLDSHKHHPHHHDDLDIKTKPSWSILFSLSLSMFLTPCVEIEAYYFRAGSIGWTGIFLVSVIYMIITVTSMIILVYAGMQGVKRIRSHYLEHHEKLITGIVLFILGMMAMFIQL